LSLAAANSDSMSASVETSALRVDSLRKRYGSTVALDGASFSVAAGSVHALLGENGAGKSTIVKILSGLDRPDSGEIAIFGKPAAIAGVRGAHALGLRTAFQEISLVKDLTVAQNFLLMEEPLGPLGLVRRRKLERQVREELERLGVSGVNPRARVSSLDLPTRQKIEIARSIARKPRLLLLDEPTASLSSRDVDWLGRLIERLSAGGTTILFISHRMQEVREFCSRLTILRNGTAVGSYGMEDLSDEQVIELTIGRSLDVIFPPKRDMAASGGHSRSLSVRSLSTKHGLQDVSFDLCPGQILGVGGLQGMGQRQLFLALFGAEEVSGGSMLLGSKRLSLRSPADAVCNGIGLVPEDRKTEGLFLQLDGQENVSLPSLSRFLRGGLVDRRREAREAAAALGRVQVAARALRQPLKNFSGGNQQKIALAKWLLTGNPVLLLYDPTRGVDVGTKAEIYRIVQSFADQGGCVLFYSSDIAELVNLCSDVIVLYRGRVTETLSGEGLTETAILSAALGQQRSPLRSEEQSVGRGLN
jgi:ribose transport system ATP-binding protein